MFDALVSSAVFPAVLEMLRATDNALAGVKSRLEEQVKGDNPMTAIVAQQQLGAIAAWEPALRDIMANLDKSHASVHGTSLPAGGHR
jgi:hypothetical protein